MTRQHHLDEAARYDRLAREASPVNGGLTAMPMEYYERMAAEHRRAAQYEAILGSQAGDILKKSADYNLRQTRAALNLIESLPDGHPWKH